MPPRTNEFSVCIEVVGFDGDAAPDLAETAKAAIEPLMPEIAYQYQAVRALTPAAVRPIVDERCPEEVTWDNFDVESIGRLTAVITSRPSPYRVFVYVVSPSEYERLVGKGYRIRGQDMQCSGDNCVSLTNAVFISTNEITDLDALKAIVWEAFGLSDWITAP